MITNTQRRSSFVLCLLLSLLTASVQSGAQDIKEFREYEDTLVVLSEIIFKGSTDTLKYNANEAFISLFTDALSLNNSFRYPFDSLKLIKILVSPDQKFRIITWMIAKENGTYEYFGFVQSYSRRKSDYEVYPLTDMSEGMESPETKVLDHKNWYGAVYYDLILTRDGASRYYTLLGWDGNNPMIRRKIIEVVTLRSNGMPRFGQSLFKYRQPQLKRVFFEYSSLTTMNLRYEKQFYYVKKKKVIDSKPARATPQQEEKKLWNRLFPARQNATVKPREVRGYRFVRKGGHMIVFDNLTPLTPSLEGQHQFYVPEGNILCAFRFSAGRWRYIEDIDARNPSSPLDKPKNRPVPEMGL